MKRGLLLLGVLLYSITSYSQVRLADIFTDNMVVQHDSRVAIWGTADPAQKFDIVASWAASDTIKITTQGDGAWMTHIPTPKADLRAHTIKVGDVTLSNVMLGNVWLCSGQSNMQWSVNYGIMNGEQEALNATNPNIRIFQIPLSSARSPQDRVVGEWVTSRPETMRKASAVGYFFARELESELDVPVGIISSAWGGTSAEVWTPSEAFTPQMLENAMVEESVWRTTKNGTAFNQMIHPLAPMTISGVLWYQGETNRKHHQYYDTLMRALITSWRGYFKNDELPFYFVQIAPFKYTEGELRSAAYLRQAQEKTSHLPHTGMVVVSDLVDDINNIHPLNKQEVGKRLANYALAEVYGKDIKGYKSPTYASHKSTNGKIVVSLDNLVGDISQRGDVVVGFEVAGKDGVYYAADAKVDASNIVVSSKQVKNPVHVRYCFDDTTIGNLFSLTGLPVAPFSSERDF